MEIVELKTKLLEAYSEQSLNKISLTLLTLYKEGQFGALNKIAEIIADFVSVEISPEGKGFQKLMMLYHPDRGGLHRNAINELASVNNFDGLLGYSHILKLLHIEEIASAIESYEDIDYSPVYEWDAGPEGYNVVGSPGKKGKMRTKPSKKKYYSFYDAIKIRMYGHTNIEFPSYYLEDIDEIELSGSSIDDLEGVEFCKHLVSLDLSGNCFSDISGLWGLSRIEELDLSGNQIEVADALSNLSNLRQLNLSGNRINDISPLFELGHLKYVELSGNPVLQPQLDELTLLGVCVVFNED